MSFVRGTVPDSPPQRVCVLVPEEFSSNDIDAVRAGFTATGCEVRVQRAYSALEAGGTEVVAVLDYHLVPPTRVRELMSLDRSHVPIVVTETTAQVGPVVVPGVTACLSCVHTAQAEADPNWTRHAVQMMGRAPKRLANALSYEAAVVAGHLIGAAPVCSAPYSVSVTVNAQSWRRSEQIHHPHAACGCLSPAGNETVPDPVQLRPKTAEAFARHG